MRVCCRRCGQCRHSREERVLSTPHSEMPTSAVGVSLQYFELTFRRAPQQTLVTFKCHDVSVIKIKFVEITLKHLFVM